jgi:ribonuclease VapC
VIVVDSSALVAIGDDEADAAELLQILIEAGQAKISPINAVETGILLIGRGRVADIAQLASWFADLGVEVDELAGGFQPALAAYLRFGRGYHRARLNLGDCFAYALATELDAPLLYKGDDFALTDVRSVRQPT